MGLTAATHLGENTFPILDDLVSHLNEGGLDVDVVPPSDPGTTDLAWLCGYLAVTMLASGTLDADLVGAPVFAGETEPVYHSVIVAHRHGPSTLAKTLAGSVAINEKESWSGHHGLRRHVADLGQGAWFRAETITGSHRASVGAVAARRCDVAAIDATIWRHLELHDPGLVAELRPIDRTADWPAPPFCLRRDLRPDVREQLLAAIQGVGPGDVPGLQRIAPAGAGDYEMMTRQPR